MAMKNRERTLGTVRTSEEDRGRSSSLNIAEDDYTDVDERGHRVNRAAVASSRRTAGLDGSTGKAAARKANRAKRTVDAVLIGAAMSSMKTGRMEKRFVKEQASIEKAQRQQRRAPGGESTFWSAFQEAFDRIQMEQRTERLKKLKERVDARKERAKRVGMAVDAVIRSVEPAARTKAMQRSMERFTANQSGMQDRDIVTTTSGRGSDIRVPSPAGRDAEPQMGG